LPRNPSNHSFPATSPKVFCRFGVKSATLCRLGLANQPLRRQQVPNRPQSMVFSGSERKKVEKQLKKSWHAVCLNGFIFGLGSMPPKF
jgi:hypothetical protein